MVTKQAAGIESGRRMAGDRDQSADGGGAQVDSGGRLREEHSRAV
jgi:hypothetical protein